MCDNNLVSIPVAARASALSKKQYHEVLRNIQLHHPKVSFSLQAIQTIGDMDQKTSLRTLDKTDFFTKEVDLALLNGQCRIAVHSAKDLPDPLPSGLRIIALTKCIDERDALVLSSDMQTLPDHPIIATSSHRREISVKKIMPHAECIDIRGAIQKRLEKLFNHSIHGVVIAEAALLRLGLTHLKRMYLDSTTPLQGQLAIVAKEEDTTMQELFSCIDVRRGNQVLYLGLDPHFYLSSGKLIHYPVIAIKPRSFDLPEMEDAIQALEKVTHIIFTSKQASIIFFKLLEKKQVSTSLLNSKVIIAVGEKTAFYLKQQGIEDVLIPKKETAEGIVALLEEEDLKRSFFLLPRSSISRDVIPNFLNLKNSPHLLLDLYDTIFQGNNPHLDPGDVDEIVFTSPSTVDGFLKIFKSFPKNKKMISIGEVTKSYIERMREHVHASS